MQENSGPESTLDEGASREATPAGKQDSKAVGQNPPKPKVRKKRKLTAEVQTEICAMISVGCTRRGAARMAGCSETAIRKLACRDEAFATRFRQACMRREVFPLRNIINAGQTHWRAAAWYLSRLNPDEYGYRRAETVTPREVERWIKKLVHELLVAIEDEPTRARLREVLDRMAPSPDPRDEMQKVTMPLPDDDELDEYWQHSGRR